MNPIYTIIEPTRPAVPIVVSVPHCGIDFPEDLRSNYKSELINTPDDTDFFVHDLYRFVSDLGITMIHANYSRWVIDLNRTSDNSNLYNDGRIITALTPTTNFLGQDIYTSEDAVPDADEVNRRIKRYYQPYYNAITERLDNLKAQFGVALLWDAHSIRRKVPTIQDAPFTDLILGTNDRQSAGADVIDVAINKLSNGDYDFAHNFPFKGGNITRHFGDPDNAIHALQLEMTKVLYMDDAEVCYDEDRAYKIRVILKNTLTSLIEKLKDHQV